MHQPAPKLPGPAEAKRVAALHAYGILDTPREAVFEDITRIASNVCGTPIAVINLVDSERQWFKAEIGLGVRETPLDTSICAHALLEHEFLEVPDTTCDPRFSANPLVTGAPGLRFYAGALLKTPDGQPLGTVCVLDVVPRTLSDTQAETLRALARQVMAQFELRRMLAASEELNAHRARVLAAAGHDLKSPLRGAMYALGKAAVGASEAQRQELDAAQADLDLIRYRLGELIGAATGHAGVSAPALVPTPVQPVFDALARSWQRAAARRDITLRFHPSDVVARTNATLLEIVLGNLAGNAIKYTPRGGAVDFQCVQDAAGVRIEVADTGIGMDPDAVESYFCAFTQAEPASEGLGVGLWIVRQTAHALGAGIGVSSSLGRGTRVSVTLPA
ncbi:GAF domain-containing sensor histidine kinase [Xanthomonas sp. XNM01]|uniref:GAF domain-containing sensor histidine kinase n=1 Tax=Xanthomonas sp. XNM01 TaxID=2769289 RepID=UPI00177D6CDE|nr:GAF domain-containing sensor histidine kinase [Xanthomonas sp. XNM01]MBD9370748.1 GAF domain-containing sensor histidine kinase [Xanthomonas sp. XNM01]